MRFSFKLLLLCVLLLPVKLFAQTVSDLKCEYLINPIGIDAPHPRLTWYLIDARESANQTAYQLAVSTDSLQLKNGKGNQWQTAKVNSPINLLTYQGKALGCRTSKTSLTRNCHRVSGEQT